jgi:hypothetical protein
MLVRHCRTLLVTFDLGLHAAHNPGINRLTDGRFVVTPAKA